MSQQLPLFPLGTVLFPGATLNLHIFEERYRLMIGDCIEKKSPFGVVLIRDGDEVEEGHVGARPAEPYSVGTTAMVSANVRLEDGRYLLTAVGQKRFRILHVQQHAPYLVASIADLPDESSAGAGAAAHELRSIYERYWQALVSATGVPMEMEELPGDPLAMAYQLADRLQVEMWRKQRWLESDLLTRLRELQTELRGELALLPTSGKRKTSSDSSWSGMGSLN